MVWGAAIPMGALWGWVGPVAPSPPLSWWGWVGSGLGLSPPLLCLDLFIYFVVLGWEEAAGVGGSWSVPELGSVQPPGTAVMSPVGVSLSLPKLTPPPWLWGAAQGGCWDSFNRLVGSPRFNCKKKRRKKEKEKKNWKRIKKTSLDPKCVGGGLGGGGRVQSPEGRRWAAGRAGSRHLTWGQQGHEARDWSAAVLACSECVGS